MALPTDQTSHLIHATCVSIDGIGVVIEGPSGSGKSDLALRLIAEGAHLVADDQTALSAEADRLIARPPPSIAGRMEVRGLGIVTIENLGSVPVGLLVELVGSDAIERVPTRRRRVFLGIEVPAISLAALEASAPAKVRLAVRTLRGGIMPTR